MCLVKTANLSAAQTDTQSDGRERTAVREHSQKISRAMATPVLHGKCLLDPIEYHTEIEGLLTVYGANFGQAPLAPTTVKPDEVAR